MAFLTPEGDFTEEELQQLMELGIIPDQNSQLDKQIATAEGLRYNKGPEMRHGNRVSTAAHPLEFLAQAAQGIKAGKDMESLRAQQAELLRQQAAGRKLFYQKMYGGQQPQQDGPMLPPAEEGGLF